MAELFYSLVGWGAVFAGRLLRTPEEEIDRSYEARKRRQEQARREMSANLYGPKALTLVKGGRAK